MWCDKSHAHQYLVGGRTAKAQEYLGELCRAICRGLSNKKRYDESVRVCSGRLGLSSLSGFVEFVESGNSSREDCLIKPRERVIHFCDGRMQEPWSKQAKANNSRLFPAHCRDFKHGGDGIARSLIDIESAEDKSIGLLFTGANIRAENLRTRNGVYFRTTFWFCVVLG